MGKAFIQESTLTDIADAIRSKNGSSDTYLPSEMAQAIQNIPTGGDNTNYFYVEDVSGAANTLTIRKSNNSLPDKVFDWSLDKQTWTTVTVTDTTGVSIAVPANGKVYLMGDNETIANNNSYTIYFTAISNFNVGGDFTTLLFKQGNVPIVGNYAWGAMFRNAGNKLISAENLIIPCVQIGEEGLSGLFDSCINLKKPCKMPFLKRLSKMLCMRMYYGCSALEEVMTLPNTLTGNGNSCFSNMYYNCVTLIDGGVIPNLGTTNYMFHYMFYGCSNLTKITVNMTTWNENHATNWLDGVAPTGDFYNLGGATIPSGTNGIPSGWTEHTSL